MLRNDMMMDESSREMVGHDREHHVQEKIKLTWYTWAGPADTGPDIPLEVSVFGKEAP